MQIARQSRVAGQAYVRLTPSAQTVEENMKKKVLLIAIVLNTLVINSNAVSETTFAVKITDTYYFGTYLPEEYLKEMSEKESHSKAINIRKVNKYHDVLFITENIVYSDVRFHDQYAIPADQVNKFQYRKENNDYLIIDDKGNTYLRIDNSKESYLRAVQEYVLMQLFNILFSKIADTNISLDGNAIIVNKNKYEIIIDTTFLPIDNIVCVRNRSEKKLYAVQKLEEEILFVELVKGDNIGYINSDKILYKFKIKY